MCLWIVTGRCFSAGLPISSTNKTDLHDRPEILLKVVLNTIKPNQTKPNHYFFLNMKDRECVLTFNICLVISYQFNIWLWQCCLHVTEINVCKYVSMSETREVIEIVVRTNIESIFYRPQWWRFFFTNQFVKNQNVICMAVACRRPGICKQIFYHFIKRKKKEKSKGTERNFKFLIAYNCSTVDV